MTDKSVKRWLVSLCFWDECGQCEHFADMSEKCTHQARLSRMIGLASDKVDPQAPACAHYMWNGVKAPAKFVSFGVGARSKEPFGKWLERLDGVNRQTLTWIK